MAEAGEPTIARLQGDRHAATLAFASTVPAILRTAQPPLTTPPAPSKNPTVLRWCTQSRSHTTITFTTLLLPGSAPHHPSPALTLHEHDGTLSLSSPWLPSGTGLHLTSNLTAAS